MLMQDPDHQRADCDSVGQVGGAGQPGVDTPDLPQCSPHQLWGQGEQKTV